MINIEKKRNKIIISKNNMNTKINKDKKMSKNQRIKIIIIINKERNSIEMSKNGRKIIIKNKKRTRLNIRQNKFFKGKLRQIKNLMQLTISKKLKNLFLFKAIMIKTKEDSFSTMEIRIITKRGTILMAFKDQDLMEIIKINGQYKNFLIKNVNLGCLKIKIIKKIIFRIK